MKVRKLHSWQLSTARAIELQRQLSGQVSKNSGVIVPRFIAGVDISVGKKGEMATGAVVVFSYPELEVIEIKTAQGTLDFPYIPGLLSFRELPLTLAAFEELNIAPDLVLVDGQGVAHPRRLGLASHLGLFLDIPTIGCAKSLLCGNHNEPGTEPGSHADIIDKDDTIGVALRTKSGVKPVYVSIGHKTDLQSAIHWVLKCCRGYRLPEPTRLAHQAAGGNLNNLKKVKISGISY
jgi:deoxyribonuclease V